MKTLLVLLITSLTFSSVELAADSKNSHEPLRYKNTFDKPEDVVDYYVKRDASGFVWSGLLDCERRAFTMWSHVPRSDSFYVAKSFQVKKTKVTGTRAKVTVRYELKGVSDGNGTFVPATQKYKDVEFTLTKFKGRWRILLPAPVQVSPVVIESKFFVSDAR